MQWRSSGVAALALTISCGCAFAGNYRRVLKRFDAPSSLDSVRILGKGVSGRINTNGKHIHSGKGSLEIVADQKQNAGKWVRPFLSIPTPAIKLSKYREITLWVYVPKRAAKHFFGRYDVRLSVNHGHPAWSLADVSPGWNHVVWNFARRPQNAIAGSGSESTRSLPTMHRLEISFGPLMNNYGMARIYVDDIRLVPMRRLVSRTREQLEAVLGNDESWSRRYQAVMRLRKIGGLRVLPALLSAANDFTSLIRAQSRRAVFSVVKAVGRRAAPDLRDALAIGPPRTRRAVVAMLGKLGPEKLGPWVIPSLRRALLDNDYFVRHAALASLRQLGTPYGSSAKYLAAKLNLSNPRQCRAAIRCLSEIGPTAKPAIPAMLALARDGKAPLKLRCWAVRAVWWTHERYLTPADWALPLALRPGQVFRHLIDLAMMRLERGGAKALPVITHALLTAKNPVVRARAAEILDHMDPAQAKAASADLRQAMHDHVWYVRWQARQDLARITKFTSAGARAGRPHQPRALERIAHAAPPVTVTKKGNTVIFDNGRVQMVFKKTSINPGPVSVRLNGGPNEVHARWVKSILAFRKSPANNMFERQWLQKLGGSPIDKHFQQKIIQQSPRQAQYVFTFPAEGPAWLEWQEHFVLRRGKSGFYVYFVLRNTSGKAKPRSVDTGDAQSVALEFNFLMAATRHLFTRKILSDNLRGPTSFGFPRDDYLQFPDIYQATWRLPNGEVDAKHEWINFQDMSPVLGLAGPKYGLWMIFPSADYRGGTEPKLQLTAFVGPLFIISLENKYFVPSDVYIGAHWQKVYGPMFIYLNKGPNSESMWIDAKRQAQRQKRRWPFRWVTNKSYHQRGTVTGMVAIAGKHSPTRAWAILSLPKPHSPKNLYGQWLRNVGSYMYWTRVRPGGHFIIRNVHAGRYDLFVWKKGILGEVRKNGLVVRAGQTLRTGLTTLVPTHHGKLLWQVGVPNRGVGEFRNGRNFHIWENYLRYGMEFPHGVNYTIGKSNPRFDWNYLEPAVIEGHKTPTVWKIHFSLKRVPAGRPLLTLICGGRQARMNVLVNGHVVGRIHTNVGLQYVRTAPYGELLNEQFRFKRSRLRPGKNTVALSFRIPAGKRGNPRRLGLVHQSWTSFMAYDVIRMEMESPRAKTGH